MSDRFTSTEIERVKIPGSPYALGYIFEYGQEPELHHRKALREACEQVKYRQRNFDQPWWGANVSILLDYVEACEDALRALLDSGEIQGGNS